MNFDIERWASRSTPLCLDGIDFTAFRAHPLPEEVVRALRYMHDVEHHTVCYLRDLLVTRLHRDPVATTFLSLWVYEEHWHGEAIGKILEAHGESGNLPRITATRARLGVRDHLRPLLSQLATTLAPDVRAVHLAWGAVNEWTTQAGYLRLAASCDHPVLAELLARIARQEGRHIDFYFHSSRELLERSAVARRVTRMMLARFWKPVGAGLMPKEEVAFLATHLFSDEKGRSAARRVDQQIDRLPGLDGLHLLERSVTHYLAA
jgi:hypothetical protein